MQDGKAFIPATSTTSSHNCSLAKMEKEILRCEQVNVRENRRKCAFRLNVGEITTRYDAWGFVFITLKTTIINFSNDQRSFITYHNDTSKLVFTKFQMERSRQ